MAIAKVKGHTHLVRDLKSQAIINTDSNAYARYMARKMGDLAWVAFNSDGTPDSAVEPSENRHQFKEHKYSASSLTAFTAFQLKITMTGTSSCYPPVVKDLRGIALAV